ncbi:pro-resilin-like [Schistocerca nitens]|uniref:pro-resilin-like n=1 Tax=Schistocerca nitens TaxID=7011 RepID=UPI002118F504|nr:pro-resilin-like [Schistocerca nitens]
MAFVKVLSAMLVAVLAAGVRAQDAYGAPPQQPQAYPGGAGVAAALAGQYQGQGQGQDQPGAPQPYSFHYEVKDPPSGNDYSHQESSDGQSVTGQYEVLLPDGRHQVVRYSANDATGYVADVQYSGGGDSAPAYSGQQPQYSADAGAAYPGQGQQQQQQPQYGSDAYPAQQPQQYGFRK